MDNPTSQPTPHRVSPPPYEPLVEDTGGNWVPPHESDVFPPGQDPRTTPITTQPPAYISSGRGVGKRSRYLEQHEDGSWVPVTDLAHAVLFPGAGPIGKDS